MTNARLEKSRELSGQEIGLPQSSEDDVQKPQNTAVDPAIAPVLDKIHLALQDLYAGIILVGQPGTGKSWSALESAKSITDGDPKRLAVVQFHPSYQYEDFMEGLVSDGKGNFVPQAKTFVQLCNVAKDDPDQQYVLLIDEISRSDVTRVFGEALTYLEPSKRGLEFKLQSGRMAQVPPNIIVLATMNPWDRGVDELDWAIERRFAKIEMLPDANALAAFCRKRSYPVAVQDGLLRFFNILQAHANPRCRIGHAYFMNLSAYDADALRRLWEFQLSHHLRKALGSDTDEYERLRSIWRQNVEQTLTPAPAAPVAPANVAT